jgi:hypothetical protein
MCEQEETPWVDRRSIGGAAGAHAGATRGGRDFKGLGKAQGALGRRVWDAGAEARAGRLCAGGAALARSGFNVSVCLCLTVFFSKFLN